MNAQPTPTIDEIVTLAALITKDELIEAINRTLQDWRDRGMDMSVAKGLEEWVKKEKA